MILKAMFWGCISEATENIKKEHVVDARDVAFESWLIILPARASILFIFKDN